MFDNSMVNDMDINVLNEIKQCLPAGRTFFYYYDDRYAAYLIQKELEKSDQKIAAIKKGRFGKLLDKPLLKPILANKGSGTLSKQDIDCLWPGNPQIFTLSLDEWGEPEDYSWCQLSRPGVNLVLQLNLSGEVNYEFEKFLPIKPNEFNWSSHPCHRKKTTLAWARMDIDFHLDEVLIEEIQSDWIREIRAVYQLAKRTKRESFELWGDRYHTYSVVQFYERVIMPFTKQWSEAMLMATIWFIWEELGINNIYFHTFDTGCVLKGLKDDKPPRSLYTELPRKFCFEKTRQGPKIILTNRKSRRALKKVSEPQWFHLAA